jgi:hypothetical protein
MARVAPPEGLSPSPGQVTSPSPGAMHSRDCILMSPSMPVLITWIRAVVVEQELLSDVLHV